MNIDANDPRWTAYALGEITDEREKAEMEGILRESAEIRELVEEIRRTAGLLKEELQAEPSVHLTPAQRERIEAKARGGRRWFGLAPAWVMAGAAAAVLLISFVSLRELKREMGAENAQMASLEEQKSLPSPVQDLEKPAARETGAVSGIPAREDSNRKNEEAASPEPEGRMAARTSQNARLQAPLEKRDKDQFAAATPLPSVEANKPADEISISTSSVLMEAPAAPQPPPATSAESKEVKMAGGVGGGEGRGVASGPTATAIGVSPADRLESSSSTGQVKTVKELPLVGNDIAQLQKTMGGVEKDYNTAFGNPREVSVRAAANGMRRYPPPRPPRRWRYERPPVKRPGEPFNTETYDNILDNPFLDATENPLSTFSIDVDTASYANVRRFLDGGSLPPKDAVRIEELVNYFDYDYKGPKNGKPFAAHFEIADAPWNPEHRLLRIGLKGREVDARERPDSNLVFLLDVSGSMADANKLPLVKDSMQLLVDRLTESDRVAIVVYASDTHLELPSTSGDRKERLRRAIERLHAGGSTNGASGIRLAYDTARKNFIEGGVNRVILATDGDFNVGITNRGDLTRLIEKEAKSGIYLSALGFGMGNYKDATLEMLAGKGHGNYAYIDTINEAKKVLVEQISATLVPIAKDVKIQVEFNPRRVGSYRLIGYEDRIMPKEDFNDDTKEAGVIGAGHEVTALYELAPAGASGEKPGVDPLKYQKPPQPSASANSDELLTVKIRSKDPEKDTSVLSEFTVKDSEKKFGKASGDFKFAAAVAAFGMVLRDSPYKGNANMERALEWAKEGEGADRNGYRHEFIRLIHKAIAIDF